MRSTKQTTAVGKVRFGDLVRHSGRPQTLVLWTAPNKNRELQRARRENRVLTIHQPPRASRDFGEIGFTPGPQRSYLVFPRRLSAAVRTKVFGINYALLEEAAEEHAAK